MLQFYFLSILLNIVAGLILIYATDFMNKESLPVHSEVNGGEEELSSDNNEEKNVNDDSMFDQKLQFAIDTKEMFFDDMTFRFVVAILSGLTGLMKLLSTVQNDVPVVGDLIPAVAGFAACFALLIEYYSQKTDVAINLSSVLTTVFVGGRKYLGIFCIIAGILHFIFPRVLFL